MNRVRPRKTAIASSTAAAAVTMFGMTTGSGFAAAQENPPSPARPQGVETEDTAGRPHPVIAQFLARAERAYRVQEGDTLWNIATSQLGDGTRYAELLRLNKGRSQLDGKRLTDSNRIRRGWELQLPGRTSHRPGITSRRGRHATTDSRDEQGGSTTALPPRARHAYPRHAKRNEPENPSSATGRHAAPTDPRDEPFPNSTNVPDPRRGTSVDAAPRAGDSAGTVRPDGGTAQVLQPTPPASAPAPAAGEGTTAAGKYGWKNLVRSDDFNGTKLDPSWHAYDGPGHAGKGIRSSKQIGLDNGVMRITGTADGTTGGMSWDPGQMYGRWEVRARFPEGCACYHPVLILWPDTGGRGVVARGGEVDYAEVFDPHRQSVNFFLHSDKQNNPIRKNTKVDLTQWHNFAVEWTPDHIRGYIDGNLWFETGPGDRDKLPPGPMHQTIQLDWFPQDAEKTTKSVMEVDWTRMYSL